MYQQLLDRAGEAGRPLLESPSSGVCSSPPVSCTLGLLGSSRPAIVDVESIQAYGVSLPFVFGAAIVSHSELVGRDETHGAIGNFQEQNLKAGILASSAGETNCYDVWGAIPI